MIDGRDKHDRLKEARTKRYDTAKEAAAALGVPYGTYSGHESGSRGFDNDEAERYARFFRVTASWLVFGEEGRALATTVRLGGQIAAGGTILTSSDQSPDGVEAVAQLKAHIPRATTAYEVVGTSMLPYFRPGSIIVCGPETDEASEFYGEEVAVCDEDGDRLLKILHPGSKNGVYNLLSHNADLMPDTKIHWVAPVIAVIPEKQWQKLSRSGAGSKIVGDRTGTEG